MNSLTFLPKKQAKTTVIQDLNRKLTVIDKRVIKKQVPKIYVMIFLIRLPIKAE